MSGCKYTLDEKVAPKRKIPSQRGWLKHQDFAEKIEKFCKEQSMQLICKHQCAF